MAYSVKFKRKKRRPPLPPLTPLRAAKILAGVLIAGLAIWGGISSYIYMHYDVQYAHSNVVWGRQLGSPGNDDGGAVAADRRGNVFVAGTTDGSLFTKTSTHNDAFLGKFTAAGRFLWGKQFGSTGDETVAGLATDSQGNVYLAGGSEGSPFGNKKSPSDSDQPAHDAFIAKFSPGGKRIWSVQFGAGGDDAATGLAVDQRDNVYVCGDTDGNLFDANADPLAASPGNPRSSDVWVVKYSPSGRRSWSLQFGAAGDDEAESIAVNPSGESFIVGGTHALFRPYVDDRDAFLAKISSAGMLAWGQQMPVRQDSFPAGVSCDADGNSFLAADMIFGEGILSASPAVAEFSSTGVIQQRVEMLSKLSLDILTATPDSKGGLLLIGSTNGRAGATGVTGHAGIVRYDNAGKRLWAHLIRGRASSLFDASFIDPANYIYAVGKAEGPLYARGAGGDDAIVVKFSPTGATQAPPFANNAPKAPGKSKVSPAKPHKPKSVPAAPGSK